MSRAYDDIFYTCNDETTTPHVFAIKGATGATVGSASISGETLVDPEALSVDRYGRLWLADIGDNDSNRAYVRLFMRAEFGAKNLGSVSWKKYLLEYEDGARNAETFLTHPKSTDRYIITKEGTSHLYKLPPLVNSPTHNIMERLSPTFGAYVSDGSFTPDGRFLLLRRQDNDTKVWVYDVEDNFSYAETLTVTASGQTKCEGITVEMDGQSFWTTSEGVHSTIHNISMPSAYRPIAPTMPGSPCGA